jgi:drug/metabolite transporter (DMT)-like permease
MSERVTSRWSVLGVWWLTCLIWSSVWLFIKVGVKDVPPFTFAATRVAIAASVLILVAVIRRLPWPSDRREWTVTVVSGVLLLGFNYGLLYWGTQFITSGVTAVLQASTPTFSLIVARLVGTERLTPARVLGVLGGVAGVAIIFLDQMQLSGRMALFGSATVTAGAVCVAVAYVLVKAYGRRLHTTTLLAGQMVSALVVLGVAALAIEGPPFGIRWTGSAISSLLYLAFAGSIGAASLNYWLLRRIDATSLLSMGFVEPFIAVMLGAVFLDERLTLKTFAGGVAVLASVWVVLRPQHEDSHLVPANEHNW